MSQLLVPIYSGDDVVLFPSEKDYYSMSLLYGASVSETIFFKDQGHDYVNLFYSAKDIPSTESKPRSL